MSARDPADRELLRQSGFLPPLASLLHTATLDLKHLAAAALLILSCSQTIKPDAEVVSIGPDFGPLTRAQEAMTDWVSAAGRVILQAGIDLQGLQTVLHAGAEASVGSGCHVQRGGGTSQVSMNRVLAAMVGLMRGVNQDAARIALTFVSGVMQVGRLQPGVCSGCRDGSGISPLCTRLDPDGPILTCDFLSHIR